MQKVLFAKRCQTDPRIQMTLASTSSAHFLIGICTATINPDGPPNSYFEHAVKIAKERGGTFSILGLGFK